MQCPEATVCAEYDLRNNTMRRSVMHGSKGIVLLDTSGGRLKLRYIFGVADTGVWNDHRERVLNIINDVPLWDMLFSR